MPNQPSTVKLSSRMLMAEIATTHNVAATRNVGPFAASMILRFALGSNRFIQWLIWLCTMWFLINVLLAPYSPGMRDDFLTLRRLFQ